ncbi:hypothetical protein LTR37_015437 [Vermiconidia calcicola]|uniref:Uncharacterized protein n=1 Tax=Vermiconidia calcicola TaxID=1690605 RepID=A0ACC3MQX5_9PEZI|nr:hypothetical protein LTR37_015437 [Vermiconidia calcicola]
MYLSTLLSAAVLLITAPFTLAKQGRATYYGGNLHGGMCSFSTLPTLPSNIYGTALSGASWANSAHCGQCLSVRAPNGKRITAMVVDQCPECPKDGLDLFENAFGAIAEKQQGIVQVDWNWVQCPISGPLSVHLKSGVSPYWFSAQVVNANKGIRELQISTNGGKTWQRGLKRMEYNFFETQSGLGSNTVDARVISVDGDRVVVKNVAVRSDNVVAANRNF